MAVGMPLAKHPWLTQLPALALAATSQNPTRKLVSNAVSAAMMGCLSVKHHFRDRGLNS
jgi:hypothetical protein